MSIEITPTAIDPARIERAKNLKVQIIRFDPYGGVTEAFVHSDSEPGKAYSCTATSNPPRSSCECDDFLRNLAGCKHIAAMCLVSMKLWQGVSFGDFK